MESIRSGVVWLSFITLAAVSSLSFVSEDAWDSFPSALGSTRTFLADCRIAPAKYRSDREPPFEPTLAEPGSRQGGDEEPPYESTARSRVRVADRSIKTSEVESNARLEPIGAPVDPTFAGYATVEEHGEPTGDIFNDAQFDRDPIAYQHDDPSLPPVASASPTSDVDALVDESANSRTLDAPFAETNAERFPNNGVAPMPEQALNASESVSSSPSVASAPIPAPIDPAPLETLAESAVEEVASQPTSDGVAVSNDLSNSLASQTPPPSDACQPPATLQSQDAPLATSCAPSPPQATLPLNQTIVPLNQTPSPIVPYQASCATLLSQGDAEGSLNAALESAKNIESAEQGRDVFVTLNQLRGIYLQNNRLDVVKRINEVLDRLAFEVFYNPQRAILEPLRQTQAGETIASIAHECNVTPATLAAINGITISPDAPLPPGTTLKVVHGPVSAEVSSSRKELLLKFNNLYAGRFPCGVPQQASTLRGEYVVENKIENPECQAVDMTGAKIIIEGGSPENPLGSRWIGLNGGYGLQGTNRMELVGKEVHENGGFVFSNLHISQLDLLLPVGSSIYFTD